MKTIYLSSDIHFVAAKIVEDLGPEYKGAKTVFINTGAELKPLGINSPWVFENKKGLVDAGLDVFDYTITGKTPEEIENDLKDVKIVHVNGGSCYHIYQQALKSGFDKWVKNAVENGIIYIGSSGGAIVTAPDISTIYRKEEEGPLGFGLSPVLIMPHWGREDYFKKYLGKEERLKKLFEQDRHPILLHDYAFLKIKGDAVEFVDVRKG